MNTKHWAVHWKYRDGTSGSTVIEWPSEPSRDIAASRVREPLLGKDFLLVDTPRGHPEPSVYFMRHYGYEIGNILPVDE